MHTAPPSIDQSRLRDSTVAVGENTSFVCSAEGYPPPMITWFLNGTRVLQQDPGNKVNMMSSQNGPYNVTTSEIVITPAKQMLNGFVKCLARSSTAEIDLPDDNLIVELVVLGKPTAYGYYKQKICAQNRNNLAILIMSTHTTDGSHMCAYHESISCFSMAYGQTT